MLIFNGLFNFMIILMVTLSKDYLNFEMIIRQVFQGR